MKLIFLTLFALIAAQDDSVCRTYLSDCQACFANPAEGCLMCTADGLQQCFPGSDATLKTLCTVFQNQGFTELWDNASQCSADTKTRQCESFSTKDNFDCKGCLEAGCGWCAVGSTGSCHNGSGEAAARCKALFLGAAEYFTDASAADTICPATGATPNYCPLNLQDCEACGRDPKCGWCQQFQDAGTCLGVGRCFAVEDKDKECLDNPSYYRPIWQRDTRYTCSDNSNGQLPLPGSCEDFTATQPPSTTGDNNNNNGGTTDANGNTNNNNNGGTTTADLANAPTEQQTAVGIIQTTAKKTSAGTIVLSSFAIIAGLVNLL